MRYEGTLLNYTDQHMNLTNVKCFGTEGRRNGINELPENEGSIASMDFKVLQLVEM